MSVDTNGKLLLVAVAREQVAHNVPEKNARNIDNTYMVSFLTDGFKPK